MHKDTLQDALLMAEGTEELPPYVDPEEVDAVAVAYSTWAFQAHTAAGSDATDESFVELINKAIAAAYLCGCLEATSLPQQADHTVVGPSGAVYNFYFN